MREIIITLIPISAGLVNLVMPLLMSAIYKFFNFSTALDFLGSSQLVNAVVFIIYSGMVKWGAPPMRRRNRESSE